MCNTESLSRFTKAHRQAYRIALEEIKNGRKYSHWMWYIFPQIYGFGRSSTSKYYAIQGLEEAQLFIQDPYLGKNLIAICQVLLNLETNNATEIFGRPDDRKLKSSMTLFSLLPDADPVFQKVLDKYFNGEKDSRTLKVLGLL